MKRGESTFSFWPQKFFGNNQWSLSSVNINIFINDQLQIDEKSGMSVINLETITAANIISGWVIGRFNRFHFLT